MASSSDRRSESPPKPGTPKIRSTVMFPNPSFGHVHGLGGLSGRVAAVHQFQTVVVEGLDADRETVDAGPPDSREVAGGQVIGVGLEGGLLGAAAVEELLGVPQQGADLLRRTERRGAAAEIACFDRFAAEVAAAGVEFAVHGLDEGVHLPQVGTFVEIAVGADALAEGYVEIDSGHYVSKIRKKSGSGSRSSPIFCAGSSSRFRLRSSRFRSAGFRVPLSLPSGPFPL